MRDLADVELGDGHYWANDGLNVSVPLRFVGDESNAGNVVVEMGGTLTWCARGGVMEGVTLRRPKMTSAAPIPLPLVRLEGMGRLNVLECCFDNEGSTGPVVSMAGQGMKGRWEKSLVMGGRGGIALGEGSSLELVSVRLLCMYHVICWFRSLTPFRQFGLISASSSKRAITGYSVKRSQPPSSLGVKCKRLQARDRKSVV